VQVPHDEGLATRIGPEPCAAIREGVGEASAGEHTGQPLSSENLSNPGADVFVITEGHMDGRDFASVCPTRRGRRPWHVWKLFVREPDFLPIVKRSW
jgi:hypothetical protein